MFAILSLLVVIVLSMLVVRVATVALTLTGLSRELARFQARSAFTGAGFTTTESEEIMRHPVRRRIIGLLMLAGNAGIVTVISSLILGFINAGGGEANWTDSLWFRLTVLFGGLAILWLIAYSAWVDRRLSQLITWALRRWTDLEVRDYAGLLHLGRGYTVSELLIEEDDWLADQSLQELRLAEEGVLVLGVERATGKFVGAPRGRTELHPGDTLIVYGLNERMSELDERRAGFEGQRAHAQAVTEQAEIARREEQADESAEETEGETRREALAPDDDGEASAAPPDGTEKEPNE